MIAATSSAILETLLTLEMRHELDVVIARQRTRQLAEGLGLDGGVQTRLATAVSELARNAWQYAGGGRVEFVLQRQEETAQLVIRIRDEGPGITDLAAVLEGRFTSSTGLGMGIVSARRLADSFHIESVAGHGTVVQITKTLPRGVRAVDHQRLARANQTTASPYAEVQYQNQELLRALADLRERQIEIERLNGELAETNRGVLALYAELEDRATDLKRASEVKSRFLSDVSHELRTPLTSVINLAHVLLARMDGPLTEEQERQVRLIQESATALTEIVNDLLDIAKIEAGHITLRPTRFTASALISSLRGITRPLVSGDAVALLFEEPEESLTFHTDEVRLSQVLRNFISNALKFTERGEIHVSARHAPGGMVRFTVRDTGIGIAAADQERIFEEYIQVDSPIQRRVHGVGLGLPLSRRLAEILGGRIELESAPGVGSTFSLVIPCELSPDARTPRAQEQEEGTS